MKLGVATTCQHIFYQGQWWTYEPFVLEMNIWHELFDELIVVAPQDSGPPPKFWAPYKNSTGITVVPYRQDKGSGMNQEASSFGEIPRMLYALIKAALISDAFHLRSPASISLLASLVVPLLQRKRCAKFAGQWTGYPGEPRTVRWQRAILKSNWWNALVTVYGEWPDQPAHVVPFFTSVLNAQQSSRAQAAAQSRSVADLTKRNLRLLFVGRLSKSKNIHPIIQAIAELKAEGIAVECDVIGDGPERSALETRVADTGLQAQVRFAGGLEFDRVLDFYERADALVLISETEGWPKAIAEAMAFGLVCIGSDRGLVPWMLGAGTKEPRGIVIPPGNANALANTLRQMIAAPAEHFEMGQRAAAWSSHYSLEGLREALRQLLNKHWQIELK
ncbi:MAG TPA: glycosyltransferase family 4 protein [Blastocatellia bacterium]|nr:glycosyltransferase family 4 protein [Blastocatellia bacterium]